MATASRHGLNEASHLLDPSINTRTAYENKPLVLRVIFLVAVSLATGFGGFTLAAAWDIPDPYPLLFLEESNKKMQVLYTAYSTTGTIGAVLGGILCHCIPVKCVVISSSIIAFVGGVVTILSFYYTMTVTGLYLFWLGLGSVIVAGLVYVREMSHDKWRSVMLGGFGVLFVFGRFADGIFEYITNQVNEAHDYHIKRYWRISWIPMLMTLPITFAIFLAFPTNPKWSVRRKRLLAAKDALSFFYSEDEIDEKVDSLMDESKKNWRSHLMSSDLLRALRSLVAGCGAHLLAILASEVFYTGVIIVDRTGLRGNGLFFTYFTLPLLPAVVSLFLVHYFGVKRLIIVTVLLSLPFSLLIFGGGQLVQWKTSPSAIPLFKDYNKSCSHTSCYSCVSDPHCGYCRPFNESGFPFEGTCSPGNYYHSFFYKGSNKYDCELYQDLNNSSGRIDYEETQWFYDFCPVDVHSPYTYMVAVFTILTFLCFCAGITPHTWTYNASVYPSWCNGICMGISTAFYFLCLMVYEQINTHMDVNVSLPYKVLLLTSLMAGITIPLGCLMPSLKTAASQSNL